MKYFLHDTNAFNDEKITLLFIEYGFEGIGLFYSILEKIASQEKPINEAVIKKQLNIKKKLQKQLDFMYEIDLLSIKNGDVFNENLLTFSEKYQIKKEKTRKRVSEWREKQADIKNVTCYKGVRNTPKVKESKVKESKENREPPIFEDFKTYAISKKPKIDLKVLEYKYLAWVENGWKTGKNTPIINWKSTLLNTLQFIPEINNGTNGKQMTAADYAKKYLKK